MKQSIKTNPLAYFVFASATIGMLTELHFPVPNQSSIPVATPTRAVEQVIAIEKRAVLRVEEVYELIAAASQKHGVPSALVKSIIAAESSFQCDVISPKGAIGLMQLLPTTAQQYGADATVPEQNVDAGTRYLSFLMKRYRNRRNQLKYVIAAYNAGFGAVDRYHGVPPYRETRGYVVRVLTFMRHYQRQSS